MTELKRCTKCGEEKGEEFFTRRGAGFKSRCKACEAELARLKRAEDPEKARAEALKAYYRSREERLIRQADYKRKRKQDPVLRELDKEKVRVSRRSAYKKCPDAFKARKQKYLAKVRDTQEFKLKQKKRNQGNYAKYRETFIANSSKRRAKLKEIPGSYTKNDLLIIFQKQEGACLYCDANVGRRGKRWHADHFIPLSRGGTNYPENIVIACADCNLSKHAKMPWEFMPEKFSPPQATG